MSSHNSVCHLDFTKHNLSDSWQCKYKALVEKKKYEFVSVKDGCICNENTWLDNTRTVFVSSEIENCFTDWMLTNGTGKHSCSISNHNHHFFKTGENTCCNTCRGQEYQNTNIPSATGDVAVATQDPMCISDARITRPVVPNIRSSKGCKIEVTVSWGGEKVNTWEYFYNLPAMYYTCKCTDGTSSKRVYLTDFEIFTCFFNKLKQHVGEHYRKASTHVDSTQPFDQKGIDYWESCHGKEDIAQYPSSKLSCLPDWSKFEDELCSYVVQVEEREYAFRSGRDVCRCGEYNLLDNTRTVFVSADIESCFIECMEKEDDNFCYIPNHNNYFFSMEENLCCSNCGGREQYNTNCSSP